MSTDLLKDAFRKRIRDLISVAKDYANAPTKGERLEYIARAIDVVLESELDADDGSLFLGERSDIVTWLGEYPLQIKRLFATAWTINQDVVSALQKADPDEKFSRKQIAIFAARVAIAQARKSRLGTLMRRCAKLDI